MVLLALAALTATPVQAHPVSAVAQATATIRVISAVRLKLDGTTNPGVPQPRDGLVRSADGSVQQAKLIEFQ